MSDGVNTIAPAESTDTGPVSSIVRDVLHDVSRIIRAEIQLARTELSEKGARAGRAAAVLAAAAVTGLLAVACFVTTCIAAMTLIMPLWLAALFMGILLSLASGGAYAMGRSRLEQVDLKPEQTVETLKEDVQWAKQRTE